MADADREQRLDQVNADYLAAQDSGIAPASAATDSTGRTDSNGFGERIRPNGFGQTDSARHSRLETDSTDSARHSRLGKNGGLQRIRPGTHNGFGQALTSGEKRWSEGPNATDSARHSRLGKNGGLRGRTDSANGFGQALTSGEKRWSEVSMMSGRRRYPRNEFGQRIRPRTRNGFGQERGQERIRPQRIRPGTHVWGRTVV